MGKVPHPWAEEENTPSFCWHEGVDYAGYFAEGNSLIFRDGNHYICISLEFLKRCIQEAEKEVSNA